MWKPRTLWLVAAGMVVALGLLCLPLDRPNARRSGAHGGVSAAGTAADKTETERRSTPPAPDATPPSRFRTPAAPPAAPTSPSAPARFGDSPAPYPVFAPTSEAARALNGYFEADASMNPADRMAALERLLRNRHEALKLLETAYHAARSAPEVTKEGLVNAVIDLQTHDAEPLLSEILREPIREPQLTAGAENSEVGMQAVVRAAAMEGLRDLARRGNRAAEQDLMDAIVDGHPALLPEAVAMYLEAGPDLRARQARLAALLPADAQYLIHRINITHAEDLPELPRPEGLGATVAAYRATPGAAPMAARWGDAFHDEVTLQPGASP